MRYPWAASIELFSCATPGLLRLGDMPQCRQSASQRPGPEAASWDVVVDSCSVRVEHGGEAAPPPAPPTAASLGPSSTSVVSISGIPSAANVHHTRRFAHLPRLARVVRAAIGRLHADAACASADNRIL